MLIFCKFRFKYLSGPRARTNFKYVPIHSTDNTYSSSENDLSILITTNKCFVVVYLCNLDINCSCIPMQSWYQLIRILPEVAFFRPRRIEYHWSGNVSFLRYNYQVDTKLRNRIDFIILVCIIFILLLFVFACNKNETIPTSKRFTLKYVPT